MRVPGGVVIVFIEHIYICITYWIGLDWIVYGDVGKEKGRKREGTGGLFGPSFLLFLFDEF